MHPPNDPVRELLSRYREAIEPAPQVIDDQFTRVMAQVAASSPPTHQRRPWPAWAILGAIAAGILLGLVALGTYIEFRVDAAVHASLAEYHATRSPTRDLAIEPSASLPPHFVPAAKLPTSQNPAEPSPPALPPESSVAEPTLPPVVPVPPQPRRRTPELDADALIRENHLISAARTAQAAADWPSVLAATAEHKREFPNGALVEERLVLEAAAACSAGHHQRGQRALTSLARRFPTSPALARVRELCTPTP